MAIHESLRKPVVGVAVVASALALIDSKFDIFDMPGIGGTETEAKEFSVKSQIKDLRNVQEVLLVKGVGSTAVTMASEFKFTGLRSPANFVGDKLGNDMRTTVRQEGELQLGSQADGIVGDSKTKAANGQYSKPYEVTVDTTKIFSQVVPKKATVTDSSDGILVRMRGVANPDESKRDQRGDELEYYGRVSFENKCTPITFTIFGSGVKKWIRAQDEINPKQPINVTYLDRYGEPVHASAVKLPLKPNKTPQQVFEDLYGNEDKIKFTDPGEPKCSMTTKVLEQIKQINGEPLPNSEN